MVNVEFQAGVEELVVEYFKEVGEPLSVTFRTRRNFAQVADPHTGSKRIWINDLMARVNDYLQKNRQISRGDSQVTPIAMQEAMSSLGYKIFK